MLPVDFLNSARLTQYRLPDLKFQLDPLMLRRDESVGALEETSHILKEKAAEWNQEGKGKRSVLANAGRGFFLTLSWYDAQFVDYDSEHDILTLSASNSLGLADALTKLGYTVYVDGAYYGP